jgi:hypothetical protein
MANANIAFDQGASTMRLGDLAGINPTTVDYETLQFILANGGTTEFVGWFDDFLGDALDARWSLNLSAGAAIAPVASTVARGVVAFTTDTDNNDFATLALGLHWLVSEGTLTFEARVANQTAITARAVEIGLSDALSETGGLAFSSHNATPVAVADNAALFGYNTANSMTTWSALAVNGGGTPQVSVLTTAPVAGAFQTFRLIVSSTGTVTYFIDKVEVAKFTAAVATTALLTPWITLKSLSGAVKEIRADYVRLFQPVAAR